ncbi:hypothetical protein DPMN_161698 [Dreissena polymorpha]|uniref:Uncharacterized protein n=1 Tax=Dreissena polymorpha TaxID=45954 RepID=A0A9D4ISV3_DREPO|nr:hypothetical protein DPMN_161698 [Dreissena polymorpha]
MCLKNSGYLVNPIPDGQVGSAEAHSNRNGDGRLTDPNLDITRHRNPEMCLNPLYSRGAAVALRNRRVQLK